ncbi:hypothetical protein [Bradyrhizobium arachidis]|uniref:Uncharacterized protein n=1 Tax=Bradyrhizobium arachidis TaxID=858423 RepID=A0AAE7NNV0_9BRAD|nr:hypothetical protein [Bradyrhizobium arachidis]QOZ68862.1 hypothetical protein WN72_22945 [Bradyrhizobium arachidis]SFV19267.1 hypothetical protein SAMN05192541_14815 [Bradyrhizobium arachidis]
MSKELKGALFFSDQPPHVTGFLVIAGTEYEIAGWKASEVRAEITARKRGVRQEPEQEDIFGGSRDADTAQERDKWAALGPTKQAGIRCKEPVFWRFLEEEHRYRDVTCEQHAADCVRHHCGIASRSDLGKPGRSEERKRWHRLDNQFEAWRIAENA